MASTTATTDPTPEELLDTIDADAAEADYLRVEHIHSLTDSTAATAS